MDKSELKALIQEAVQNVRPPKCEWFSSCVEKKEEDAAIFAEQASQIKQVTFMVAEIRDDIKGLRADVRKDMSLLHEKLNRETSDRMKADRELEGTIETGLRTEAEKRACGDKDKLTRREFFTYSLIVLSAVGLVIGLVEALVR